MEELAFEVLQVKEDIFMRRTFTRAGTGSCAGMLLPIRQIQM